MLTGFVYSPLSIGKNAKNHKKGKSTREGLTDMGDISEFRRPQFKQPGFQPIAHNFSKSDRVARAYDRLSSYYDDSFDRPIDLAETHFTWRELRKRIKDRD